MKTVKERRNELLAGVTGQLSHTMDGFGRRSFRLGIEAILEQLSVALRDSEGQGAEEQIDDLKRWVAAYETVDTPDGETYDFHRDTGEAR